MDEEKTQKEENRKQQNALKQVFEHQIKMREVMKKYEKLFEQNLEKQLLVISLKLYLFFKICNSLMKN